MNVGSRMLFEEMNRAIDATGPSPWWTSRGLCWKMRRSRYHQYMVSSCSSALLYSTPLYSVLALFLSASLTLSLRSGTIKIFGKLQSA